MSLFHCSIQVLEELGFSFSLDYDDELIVEPPEFIDPKRVVDVIMRDKKWVTMSMKCRRERMLQQFVGGPFSGQPLRSGWLPEGAIRCFNLKRAWWAVYEIQKDGRAFFRGHATSEQKGRRLQLSTKE